MSVFFCFLFLLGGQGMGGGVIAFHGQDCSC